MTLKSTARQICLPVVVAILATWNSSSTDAVIVGLSSVRNSGYYLCDADRELDWKVIQAIENDGVKFVEGVWFNGKVSMRFKGETKALNQQIDGLKKCPAKRVIVQFKALRKGCDWAIDHDPNKGVFVFTVSLVSDQIERDKVTIPTFHRPELEQ